MRVPVGRLFRNAVLASALSLALPAYAETLPTFFGKTGQFIEYVPKSAAPNVTFRDETGARRQLSEFKGKALLVNIWATWCTPCIREMETIEGLQHRLADTDVEFLIVAAEGERPVRRHLRRYAYDLPIYLEVDRMPAAFGVRGLPTSWVIDRLGRIVLLRHGEAVWDTDEVEAFIRAVARS